VAVPFAATGRRRPAPSRARHAVLGRIHALNVSNGASCSPATTLPSA